MRIEFSPQAQREFEDGERYYERQLRGHRPRRHGGAGPARRRRLHRGFQFCRLSPEPLFDAQGQIRSDVAFAQLAEFVWFAETGTGYLPASFRGGAADPGIQDGGEHLDSHCRRNDELSPLLGVHDGRAIYLLYSGILKDRSVAGGNVLAGPMLDALPAFAGPKVIYAAACRLGAARLRRDGITFKQTPYALEV